VPTPRPRSVSDPVAMPFVHVLRRSEKEGDRGGIVATGWPGFVPMYLRSDATNKHVSWCCTLACVLLPSVRVRSSKAHVAAVTIEPGGATPPIGADPRRSVPTEIYWANMYGLTIF